MKTYTIPEAQTRNAALYRDYARRAPWNSKTRQEWLRLAEEAEATARQNPPELEMEVPDGLEPILRHHGAVRYKVHPSGLSAVFDASESLWFFYESPAAGEYRLTGSSSRFE